MAKIKLKDQLQDFISKFNPGSLCGLDIGSHSIKICELSGSLGKITLEKFGVFRLSEAALIEDEIQKPSEIAEGILKALSQAGINSRLICLGMFGPHTMTKRLNAPDGNAEEVEAHVIFEAEQYITFGADDSKISYDIIGANDGGGSDVIVAAIRIEVANTFMDLLRSIKLNPKIIDLNVLALTNIFENVSGDDIDEFSTGTLLLDIGAQCTKIIVYKRGGPVFTKEIPIGGSLITEEIQRQLELSYDEAEDLKMSQDENGNLPEEILTIIENQLDYQVEEIRKNVNFYISQGSTEKVYYCFITGGSSLLPGINEKLSMSLGIPVENFNVFSAVSINEKKIHYDVTQLAAISPVAIGLGLRKFNE